MPFMIEVKPLGEKYWIITGVEETKEAAEFVIALCTGKHGIPQDEIRCTEQDEARIAWRFAQDKADRKLRKYIKANDRAFDLKTKIRPR